jgi:hypothetical protein
MEYSEDGTSWTAADTVTGETTFGSSELRTFTTSEAQPSAGGAGASDLGDLGDVDVSDTTTGHVLTRQADGSFAMEAPPVGSAVPAGQTFRYWRLLLTEAGGYNGGALSNIEFREIAAGANAATGGTATAGSTGGGAAANLFDADTATIWFGTAGAIAAGTAWISYDFGDGNDVWISEYVVQARPGSDGGQAPVGWELQYSDDGTSWTAADTVSGETTFGAAEARTFTNSATQPSADGAEGSGAFDIGEPAKNLTWDTTKFALSSALVGGNPYVVARSGGIQNWEYFAISTEPLPSTGVHYFEIVMSAGSMSQIYAGIVGQDGPTDAPLTSTGTAGWDNGVVRYDNSSVFRLGTSSIGTPLGTWNTNAHVLRVLYDADRDRVSFGADGVAPNVDGTENSDWFDMATVPGPNRYICASLRYADSEVTLRTREGQFTQSIPAGATAAGAGGLNFGLDDIGDVSTAGAATGDVLTRQADGTYALETPSGGSLTSLLDVSLPTTDDADIGRPFGLVSRSPDAYGLLPLMAAVPVSGGVDVLAENDFATNNGTSLVAADTHLYDEIYIVGYELSDADVDLFFRPDGTNPAVWDIERLRMNAGGAVTVDLDAATDQFWFGDSGSNHSFRAVIKGTKAGIPLSLDRVFGTRSNAGFNHAVGIAKTTEECRALAVTFQSTVTTGRVYIVGVRQSSQPIVAPFSYTGTPSGVETLGRFVLPMAAKIRSGAQGQFKNGTNNSAASSVNIRVAGGATLGTISLPDTGDPVVSISADVDLDAGDVLEVVTTQAETFTDLYGTLLLEGRG